MSLRGSSIDYEPRLMKRRSQVLIPPPLPLHGHVKKKKKKERMMEKSKVGESTLYVPSRASEPWWKASRAPSPPNQHLPYHLLQFSLLPLLFLGLLSRKFYLFFK